MSWPVVELKDVAAIDRNGIEPSLIGSGQRYVGLEHIGASGEAYGSEVQNGDLASTKFSFTEGHVLFGKLRPYLRKIARPSFSGICSTDILPIRPGKNLDRSYLFHFFRTDDVIAKAASLATGANLPRLSPRLLESFELPLPPLDEQRRIAAILDQADDLSRKRRAALERLEELRRQVFVASFGDWSRPGFNGKLIRLGDCLDFLTSGSRGWAAYYKQAGSRFLRIQNVKANELDLSDIAFVEPPDTAESKRTRVEAGDVLLSITADLGRSAVVPNDIGECYINQHLCILRSSTLEPHFLAAAIASPAGQKSVQGKNKEGVKAGLNFDDVRSLEIPDVERSQQIGFSARVAEIDKLKAVHRIHLAKLDALFASLQPRAFGCDL